VSLQLNALPRVIRTSTDAALARVARLRVLVDRYIRETRESITNLRSPLLENMDLVTALKDVGMEMTQDADVAFDFDVIGESRGLGTDIEHQLLRIAQEAVSNAIRHSSGRRVWMSVEYGTDAVTLRVADDGCGFNAEKEMHSIGSHYGLSSMKERAEALGGSLRVASAQRRGTEVCATLPLHRQLPVQRHEDITDDVANPRAVRR
jgi:signal transduction histidine kinase